MIAFYYGITGFACPIFYRRELFKSAKSAILVGLAPLLGGLILAWVFIKSCIDLANPENSESGDSWFGLGPPLVIGVGFLLFGVLLMFLQQRASPEFFRRRPEVVGPDGKAISAPTVAPTSREGSPMAGEVIVGYDGSACAKGALSQAVEQARAFGAGLVIAFAYEPPVMGAEHQARMIVVGTHGEPPITGVVLGSTAYNLLHRSPVPVLVVRVPEA
jgi:hypothetical protein